MGVYQWKSGSFFTGDPQSIGEELAALPEITPATVVKAASRKKSAMHDCFTWDNQEAAEQWRLQEARQLVGSIITFADETDEENPVTFRAFESVVINEQRQYVETKTALQSVDLRAQILSEISASIGELERKAEVYADIAMDKMTEVRTHLKRAREAVTV